MSDIRTLHDWLDKLVHGSNSISGTFRDLLHSGVTHARHAMRSEIAETQFLRRLVFRNDRNEEIAFDVASGRVLRVSPPTSEHFQENLPDVSGQDISKLAEGQISRLVAVVTTFTSGSTELSVEVQILKADALVPDMGISLDDLFQDLGKSPPPQETPPSEDFLGDFLAGCAPISCAALLMVGDKVTVEHGSDAHLHPLKTLARAERVPNATSLQSEAHPGPVDQCVIYSGYPDGGQAILCASQSERLALLLLNNNVLEEVFEVWMSLSR
jgi:hypothetical protein